jgi:integrase
MYRRARYTIPVNPTTGLEIPAAGNKAKRALAVDDAARRLDALTGDDKAIWAAMFYAGLRTGESRALRVEKSSYFPMPASGLIHVEHSWDRVEGQIDTKSTAGVRTIPVCGPLYDVLSVHLAGRESGLAFGDGETPWGYWAVRDRAERVWRNAGLEPTDYRFHEARHSFSSYLDAAGVSSTRADRYMGHSDNSTPGRYRHQLELELVDDAKALSEYLSRAVSPATAHQLRTSEHQSTRV